MGKKIFLVDVGNVLVRATHGITRAIFEDYGIDSENAGKLFTIPGYAKFSRGDIDGKSFYQGLMKAIPEGMGGRLNIENVKNAHNAHIYEVDREMFGLTRYLGKDRVVIVTDTNAWQNERVDQMICLEDLSFRVFKSDDPDVRSLKKEPKFFQKVIRSLKAHPNDLVLIDDSPEKLEMARKLGIRNIRHYPKNPEVCIEEVRKYCKDKKIDI